LGEVLYESGHYEQAVEQLHKTLDLDPTFAEAHRLLGRTYEQQERHKEAIAEFEKALTYSGESPQCAVLLGYAYARSGQKGKAEELLRRITSKPQQVFVSPDDLSRLYASLGNKDEAFRLLQQSYEQRLPSMVNLKVDPTFDVLRPDPRFQELLKNIGLQHKN
jgi:Flp pilus assembly protein TadD